MRKLSDETRRKMSESHKIPHQLYDDDAWLRDNYISKFKTMEEMAILANCCITTIHKYLKLHNIQARPKNLGGRIHTPETRQKIREKLAGNRNSANWSPERHASFLEKNSGPANFMYGKKRSPIECKHISDGHKGINAGAKHPNWQGGKSYEPYCPKFNDKLKEDIRVAFDHKCFICGTSENGRKLSVHHVDYNKGQGCGQRWSLVPLCRSCHMKTGYNRWYWFNLLSNYWALNPDIQFGANYDIYTYHLERNRYDNRRKGRRAQ